MKKNRVFEHALRVITIVLVIIFFAILLSSYNKSLIDTKYNFSRAIIGLPNGNFVEGPVSSWTDFKDGDQFQVTIKGKTYLPAIQLQGETGDKLQGDVETSELYKTASEKYNIYHLAVDDKATSYRHYVPDINSSFSKYLDSDHLHIVTLDDISEQIVSIVEEASADMVESGIEFFRPNMEISW